MITLDEIRKNIKMAIKQSGKTQVQIAKELNVTQSCIAHYNMGDTMPSLDTFANLFMILDVDSNDILGITNNMIYKA